MTKYLLLLLVLAGSPCAFGNDAAKADPIDVAMNAAMDKDPSTAGAVRAISDAGTAWDNEMNSAWQSLRKKMAPDEWRTLVLAQKAWSNYRDLQIKSLDSTYSKMDGSMWVPVSASRAMEITKERALFLQSLLDNISER